MSELMGIDMPEFQLSPARRDWLRTWGTVKKEKKKSGRGYDYFLEIDGDLRKYDEDQYESFVDDTNTLIYYGLPTPVHREKGMEAIEATPAWVLRAIMQHAAGNFRKRDRVVWPESVWDVKYGVKSVLINNKVDDDVMPEPVRRALVSEGSTLISRFLIRMNPEYAETKFIGIRRDKPKLRKLPDDEPVLFSKFGVDDYLFPDLRDVTADTETVSGLADEEE